MKKFRWSAQLRSRILVLALAGMCMCLGRDGLHSEYREGKWKSSFVQRDKARVTGSVSSSRHSPAPDPTRPNISSRSRKTENSGSGTDLTQETGVDLDLTEESSSIAYTQIFDMMNRPGQYTGKKIRITGIFAQQYSRDDRKRHYACLVLDPAGCCTQGIEFIPTEAFRYPDDFPEDGSNITVTGTFCTYEENENTYAVMKDTVLDA